MKTIYQSIHQAFQKALQQILTDESALVDPMLRETTDKKFGDYQSNAAMGLAKKLKKNPRELAQEIIDKLEVTSICSKIEIAGPGFINLHLKTDYLASYLLQIGDDRLGIEKTDAPELHVIDFSSPNLAKEMHVGHLRTTITGEVISRIIEFVGHPTRRVNHVGDWGTQFGMLLEYIYRHQPEVIKNPDQFEVKDLESFYKKAKACFDDEEFADASRKKVVLLQSGDETAVKVWRAFLQESLRHCHDLYKVLGVELEDQGESFYNDQLPLVVKELQEVGIAQKDQGAVCIFLDGFENRDGNPLPMIIQKSDGGFNYDTTDLAALKYRVQEWQAKKLIYITDIRQAQHFSMLFAASRKAGYADNSTDLEHIGYGMVLGKDRKPFKTRDGNTVRLKDLVSEAVERSRAVVTQSESKNFSPEQQEEVANAVGLAAIKYADLSHNLSSDYVFDWDKMLAMDGNTGPYMLYAYARVRSIGRKAKVDLDTYTIDKLYLSHPTEITLAKMLAKYGDEILAVFKELKPNMLTEYLYVLSKAFSSFYDKKTGVPVLTAQTDDERSSRLYLCALTAKALKLGLNLLSIEVVEEM
jgi:arginyl-tRNA synthetase